MSDTSTTECATPACQPSTGMFCDDNLIKLPPATRMRLVGAKEKCLHEFPDGVCGFVFFDGFGGAIVSPNPLTNFAQLVSYLRGPNNEYLQDADSKLLEGPPPGFPYLLVEVPGSTSVAGVDCCGKGNEIRKWRGQPGRPGFVFWDGELNQFVMRGLFDSGIVTKAEIKTASSLKILGTDVDKKAGDDQEAKHLKTGVPDLITLDGAGNASGINPEKKPGVVYFDPNQLDSNANPKPVVVNLCEIGKDECGNQPTPLRLLGCDEKGNPTSSKKSPELPQGASSHVLADCGKGYETAPVGLSFWPAGAILKSATAQSGNKNLTIEKSDIETAIGSTIPEHAVSVAVRGRVSVTGEAAGVEKRAELSVGGKSLGLARAQWQDPDNAGTDRDDDTGSAIVPLSDAGAMSLVIDHPDTTDSIFDYYVHMDGFYVAACALTES